MQRKILGLGQGIFDLVRGVATGQIVRNMVVHHLNPRQHRLLQRLPGRLHRINLGRAIQKLARRTVPQQHSTESEEEGKERTTAHGGG
jgi:hypothetical protein